MVRSGFVELSSDISWVVARQALQVIEDPHNLSFGEVSHY